MMFSELEQSIRIKSYKVDEQLKRMVYERSEEAFSYGKTNRDNITTIDQLEKYKMKLRTNFINILGELPSSETQLNSRITGTIKCKGFRIEKVIFESRPKVYVTANVYIPDNITSETGAVLFLCGHKEDAKHNSEYQVVCNYLVNTGLIVMAQDPIGQGERFSYYDKLIKNTTIRWGTTEHEYAGCQSLLLGDSIARYFVHDAMRSIDYLSERADVDENKIGITGNSGGGTQTSLMMLCDPRIAAAAPGTFITNRRSYMYSGGIQDSEQIWPGFTALGYDHEDILLSLSPKPVRVLAVKSDFFPIEGTRETVSECKKFWELYGMSDNLDIIEDNSIHKYTQNLAKSAAEFFSKNLLGERISINKKNVSSIESAKLFCTKTGQIKAEYEDAIAVYEENCMRLSKIEESRKTLSEKHNKDKAIKWLNNKVFANRKVHDLNPRYYSTKYVENFKAELCYWWSQAGIFNHGCVFKSIEYMDQNTPVTLAIWVGGTKSICSHMKFIRETCLKGRAVMVLDVTADGALKKNSSYSQTIEDDSHEIHKLTDDLVWMNDSMVALRTYDVIRALDMIDIWQDLNGESINIYSYGDNGIYALLATLLDNRIKNIQVENCIDSYAEIVTSRHYDFSIENIMNKIFPNVLKYFDLPDIKKWIKNRSLNK